MKTKIIIVLISLLMSGCAITRWKDSINNPVNEEYVIQTAMDYGVPADSVTQQMFNVRYCNDNSPDQIVEIIKKYEIKH